MIVIILALFLPYAVKDKVIAIPEGDTWVDDFNSSILDSVWSWIGEEPSLWSLTANPGYMHLSTTVEEAGANFLVQPFPDSNFMIETHVYAQPLYDFQNAGLLLYLDSDNQLSLIRAMCTYCGVGDNNGIYFDHILGGSFISPNYGMAFTPNDEAYLRIFRVGNTYIGYVSADGGNWTLVGSHTLSFTPQYIGLRASNKGMGDPITADFDYFKLTLYAHQQFLPLVIK